jgi:predicted RNA binding protein YcfA (HicA-like mRNA interferase family)
MPSSDELKRGLSRIGFTIDEKRGKGSHSMAFLRYEGRILLLTTIPHTKDIPPGTLSSIKRNICLKDATEFKSMLSGELSKEDYLKILKRENKI